MMLLTAASGRSFTGSGVARNSSTISPSIRFCFRAAATTISVPLSCLARSIACESQSSIPQDRRTLIRATPSTPKRTILGDGRAKSPRPAVSNAVACATLSKDGRARHHEIRARRSRSSSTMTRPTYRKRSRHGIPALTPRPKFSLCATLKPADSRGIWLEYFLLCPCKALASRLRL
jgi:hypothetical protein